MTCSYAATLMKKEVAIIMIAAAIASYYIAYMAVDTYF